MEIYTKIESNPKYEVSNLGNIREEQSKVLVKAYKLKNGYLGVRLNSKLQYVHRLVALTFIPNPNDLPQVNHKNLNKLDNSVENLEWVSPKTNIRHSYSGNTAQGRKKLTSSDVTAIKFYWSTGDFTHKALAEAFGVARPTISRVLNGSRWGWLGEVENAA